MRKTISSLDPGEPIPVYADHTDRGTFESQGDMVEVLD